LALIILMEPLLGTRKQPISNPTTATHPALQPVEKRCQKKK